MIAALLAAASMLPSTANAWFLFFIPTGLFTGKGDTCLGANAKVGDTINSLAGNTASVKEVAGTSSRCKSTALPTLATVEYNFKFQSKVALEVPSDYEQKQLAPSQRFNGLLLHVENATRKTGFMLDAYVSSQAITAEAVSAQKSRHQSDTLQESRTVSEERITVNGLPAVRFETAGTLDALFRPKVTYITTVIQAPAEVVTVTAWTPTEDFAKNSEALRQLAYQLKGLQPDAASAAASAPPVSRPAASGMAPQLPATTSTALAPPPAPPVPVAATATAPPSTTAPASASSNGTAAAGAESVANRLRELDKLFKDGVINQTEYDAKKKELLKAL